MHKFRGNGRCSTRGRHSVDDPNLKIDDKDCTGHRTKVTPVVASTYSLVWSDREANSQPALSKARGSASAGVERAEVHLQDPRPRLELASGPVS